MLDIPKADLELLIRDKYDGDRDADLAGDAARLASGEPLAYVIGWIPFLGLRIRLDSRPLIPRPETEWWTEALIGQLEERFGEQPFRLLDLCAGSGAVGLAVLARFPHAEVAFGEVVPAHAELIRANLEENGLDAARADIRISDLLAGFAGERFDVIATNPPYVPEGRDLDRSVRDFEPRLALYAGAGGVSLIRRIAEGAAARLGPAGELWMECDISNAGTARELLLSGGAQEARIRTDLYGRERLIVAHYP